MTIDLNKGSGQPPPRRTSEPVLVRSGLNMEQVTDLLDWLEANGFTDREVVFDPNQGFTVSCWEKVNPEAPPESSGHLDPPRNLSVRLGKQPSSSSPRGS
jgi:hypothetical protein